MQDLIKMLTMPKELKYQKQLKVCVFTFLSGFASSVARSQPRMVEEQEEVKSAQSLVYKGRKRAWASIAQCLLNKKPITMNLLLEDHNRYEYKDEMFTMYQFICRYAENSIKQIVDYAVDDFNVKQFYKKTKNSRRNVVREVPCKGTL